MTGREAMIGGQWYQDDPVLREQRRRCARQLERFNSAADDDDAVVGLGSVVVRDVPPGTLVAGNPVRVIRTL